MTPSSQPPAQSDDSTPVSERQCPHCAGVDIFTKYSVGTHCIVRCKSCTLMWLHPRPQLSDLHAVYDASYFQNRQFFEGTSHLYGYYDYFEERFMKQAAYQGLLRNIKQMSGFDGGGPRRLKSRALR